MTSIAGAWAAGGTVDYAAEPRVYPDGHECNYYCKNDEHCDLIWHAFDPGDVADAALGRHLAKGDPWRLPIRQERATEVRPMSEEERADDPEYDGTPETEVVCRYWYIYPASIEAAVGR